MCNYYGRHRPASELQKAFGFVDTVPNLEPRYVVRPTDTERVVAISKDGGTAEFESNEKEVFPSLK
jgi:hypothetical protein